MTYGGTSGSGVPHLILPMAPTPNGRLHVGHLAGPYLRADALARRLRRDGERALLACGTDAYESWVAFEAARNEEPVGATCRRNHEGIRHDLELAGIVPDVWVDPLEHEHRAAYVALHERLFMQLRQRGAAFARNERIPVSAVTDEPLMGVWIVGDCPECGKPVAGNSCVLCGAGFQPEELRNPRSRIDQRPVRWRTQPSWFVDPGCISEITAEIEAAGPAGEFLEIVRRHIARSGTRVRITQPGAWGIRSALVDDGEVLTNTWYGFALYLGQVTSAPLDQPVNALAGDADAVVVSLFGKDNAGIGLVAPYSIAHACGEYRAFDYVALNHLLGFEGEKCSASKRHGIWVGELLQNTSVTGDELRYCLAQIPLERERRDLTIDRLIDTISSLRRWQEEILDAVCAAVEGETVTPEDRDARKAIASQAAVLRPARVLLAEATSVLTAWMAAPPPASDSQAALSWLRGFALLAEPVLPRLAGRVWAFLGLQGSPTAELPIAPSPAGGWSPSLEAPLTRMEVKPCARFGQGWAPGRAG